MLVEGFINVVCYVYKYLFREIFIDIEIIIYIDYLEIKIWDYG